MVGALMTYEGMAVGDAIMERRLPSQCLISGSQLKQGMMIARLDRVPVDKLQNVQLNSRR